MDYGPCVLNDTEDVSAEKLENVSSNFYKKVVVKEKDEINMIEEQTKEQHLCNKWKRERKLRLTSSNFGKVMQRKCNNVSTSLVKDLLHSNFKGNMYTVRGLAQEANTIIEYQANKPEVVKVENMGLMVYDKKPFLAASTDGRVTEADGDVALIEIKNVLQSNKLSLKEASKQTASFCLKVSNSGVLSLKENHQYYYQCQGELNIFGYNWIDFVVRRRDPYEIHIERIYRDESLWKNMIPKLEAFYFKFILPELAVPRYGTVSGIRKPASPWYEGQKTTKKVQQSRTTSRLQHPSSNTSVLHANTSATPQQPSTSTSVEQPSTSTSVEQPSTSTSVEQPSTSTSVEQPNTSGNVPETRTCKESVDVNSSKGKKRIKATKFVGRTISHEWCIGEVTKETKWFKGTVLDVKTGKDGSPSAVYEVLYEGEGTYEVDNLHEDLNGGSLVFVDL